MGSLWRRTEAGIIGEVKKPALDDWSGLDSYRPPRHLVHKRSMDYMNRKCDKTDKFMLSAICARPFERLQFVRGTENAYMNMAYDCAEIRKLLGMIHEFSLENVAGRAESNVDAVFMMDDWGTSSSLLISPEMWRSVFKPLYKEYCNIAHEKGKYVFFHTDGFIEPIYGDLIEIGMDAINSQLFCMNIEGLAEQYKGKVTFWGEIDRQHVLPFGSTDEVRSSVKRVRDALDDGQGGVIAQCEWGKDNPPENIEAVFQAWLEQ
ncbi:MAG: uroporphyrinogen decarboxylase family protein [Kiritimatiellia bacterium]